MLTEPHVRLLNLMARIAVEEFIRECDDASPSRGTDLDQHQQEMNSDE